MDHPVDEDLLVHHPRRCASGRMKILIICMILYDLRIVAPLALGRWREEQQQQAVDTETFINPYDEVPPEATSWSGDRLVYELMEPRKRVDITVAHRPEEPSSCIRVVARSACACESQYELKDLGEGHYPRYLPISRCKPKTCQSKFHSCKLLHYTVHVLSERKSKELQPNDGLLQETPLPESLRHKWQLKPMAVSVACVSIR